MSSARNVHFERARALGSMNAGAFGFVPSITNTQKIMFGAGLVYAGLGFPGMKTIGKSLKNIAKYHKRDTAENLLVAGGGMIIMSGLAGAYRA